MFRIVRKLPSRTQLLNSYRVEKKAFTRNQASKPGKEDLCPPKEVKNSSGALYTFGALAVAASATIGYAKYDDDFRKTINDYVPGFDDFLALIFMEGDDSTAAKRKQQEAGPILVKSKSISEKPIQYQAPAPVFDKVAEETKPPIEYAEIRVSEKVPGKDDTKLETLPFSERRENEKTPIEMIADFEAKMSEDAMIAVKAFNRSLYALKNYNYDIEVIVEESVENIHPDVWNGLKEKTIEKNQAIEEAELHSQEALCSISKLKEMLGRVDKKNVPEAMFERTKANMQRIQEDLARSRKDMDVELQNSKLTEKYWEKVDQARKHFSKELEALFPNINFNEKEVAISSSDIDLFVLHAMSKVLFFQKELNRLDTLGNKRLQNAIDEAKRTGNVEPLTREQICQQLEKEKRALELQHNRKCLQLRQQSESELRNKLKLQSEAFTDHLDDAIRTREQEMERLLNRKFDEELQLERTKYKMQVSAMVGRLRGMEEALKARSDADKTAKKAQILWSACQTLIKAVKTSAVGKPAEEQLRPLKDEITAVKKASNETDELVNAVIDAIPEEALSRGVFPEDVLRERFLAVEKVARNVALLPETGGRLHLYFLSYLQSLLLMNATNPIPVAEMNDDKVDFTKLTNNDVLQRARYWLDRGDFAQALKYMNLLKGAPRTIARQWMNETRILLETQQAASTLMAYATSSGLMYL